MCRVWALGATQGLAPPADRCRARDLRAIFALLVERLEVDPVVLRHDEALRRKAFPGLSHQDDPQEIDVGCDL
jgi:hypothetical protein